MAFFYGRIGKAHHVKTNALANIHFNGNGDGVYSRQGTSISLNKHIPGLNVSKCMLIRVYKSNFRTSGFANGLLFDGYAAYFNVCIQGEGTYLNGFPGRGIFREIGSVNPIDQRKILHV